MTIPSWQRLEHLVCEYQEVKGQAVHVQTFMIECHPRLSAASVRSCRTSRTGTRSEEYRDGTLREATHRFTQISHIKASDPAPDSLLGVAVALSGADLAIAFEGDSRSATESGVV